LIHITSGSNLTLKSTEVIANGITKGLNKKVEVIIGARLDSSVQNRIKVIAILTGLDKKAHSDQNYSKSKFNMKKIHHKLEPEIRSKNMSRWEIPLIR
jgi:cell division GTPase FtsZ